MKKSAIILASLLTTSISHSSNGEAQADLIKQLNAELVNAQLASLTELLNQRPINDDQIWQKKVNQFVEDIYLQQKLNKTNQNPTCAMTE